MQSKEQVNYIPFNIIDNQHQQAQSLKLDLSIDRLCVREIDCRDGSSLYIAQCQVGDVGCVVWDAALVLTHYLDGEAMLDENGLSRLRDKSVIELGAGTGIVGIQAAVCGAVCILTDLEEFVPLIDLNIEKNRDSIKGSAISKRLDWGSDVSSFLPSPDYLLLADCIYYEQSLGPLVKTIDELSGINTVVLCCYEKRTTGNKPELERRFFELMSKRFHVEDVPLEEQDPVFSSEDIRIVRIKKLKIDDAELTL